MDQQQEQQQPEEQQRSQIEASDNNENDNDNDDGDHSMSIESDEYEEEVVPSVASVPRVHDDTTARSLIATSRKRSLPMSGAATTQKHLRVGMSSMEEDDDDDEDGTHQAFLANEDIESIAAMIQQVTSLDELLQQRQDLLFHPPNWFKVQLRVDEDETMLHFSIRKNARQAALLLIRNDHHGQYIHAETSKGVTPLLLAAQKGNLECVRLLLERGAKVAHVTVQGTTAVLQAAHFGHFDVLKCLLQHSSTTSNTNTSAAEGFQPTPNLRLMELSNFHHTTPLMRAAQEGHLTIVKYLVERGALVNRKNRQCMTALMLASQRGHANVCEYLIKVGHADMDATTESKSTPLLVACKRNHLETVKVLVTAGCELFQTDARRRTAYDIALTRARDTNRRELLRMLDPVFQIHYMRQAARKDRSLAMMHTWKLVQSERAVLRGRPLHEWTPFLRGADARPPSTGAYWKPSTMALLRTMTLPESLVRSICEFAPMPCLWETRVGMLTKRSLVNPNAALEGGLDLMDEVLEEAGLLQVLDMACVPPPVGHAGWMQWKRWSLCSSKVAAIDEPDNDDITNATDLHRPQPHQDRPIATTAQVPLPSLDSPSLVSLRRHAGYLKVLSSHAALVVPILTAAPYRLPPMIAQQLVTSSDIASLVRRVGCRGGVHFDTPIALDFIMLTSRLCSWHYSSASNQNHRNRINSGRDDEPHKLGLLSPPSNLEGQVLQILTLNDERQRRLAGDRDQGGRINVFFVGPYMWQA